MSFESVMPPYNVSDPTATFLSSSCLDFLLIELVPMAYRVANELELASAPSLPQQTLPPQPPAAAPSPSLQTQQQQQADPAAPLPSTAMTTTPQPPHSANATAAAPSAAGPAGQGRTLDEDEERDAVFYRLDALGYRVGQGLVERFARDRPRCNDTLDVIKFLCKDLWSLVFRKQVDNLKTNHRVCVLPPPLTLSGEERTRGYDADIRGLGSICPDG